MKPSNKRLGGRGAMSTTDKLVIELKKAIEHSEYIPKETYWITLVKFVQAKCIESELKGMKYVYHNPARNKYFGRITALKADLSELK